MDDNEKRPIKGIRIRTVNYCMIFISAVLYVLLLIIAVSASKEYSAMVKATDNYIESQAHAAQIADGSDYLTEQVQLYVMTMQPQYMENYFYEANVTRRREKGLEEMAQYNASDEAIDYLEAALFHSNKLMEREIYAMKLIAVSQGSDIASFPAEIQNAHLTVEDGALTSAQMIDRARDMIFDTNYQDAKAAINSNVSSFVNSAIEITHADQQSSLDALRRTMVRQEILISVLFVLNLITFAMVIVLIIKPLQLYIDCIKEEKMLSITGAYEFKYLALTYNDIYEVKASHEAILRHRAEHDPLTGLINRGAFEKAREFFRINPRPLALLIIDVDNFKQVNDSYGHETGDLVLKRVAGVINDSFRSNDYPARIGGDEFAVIVTDITEDLKPTILNKIAAMSEALSFPSDNLPAVTLSIGGAFSAHGFADDLYNKADSALYDVKESGRNGCKFYEEKDTAAAAK